MGIQYLSALNMNQNPIYGLVLQSLPSAPENPVEGQIYFDTVDNQPFCYVEYDNGNSWVSMAANNSGAVDDLTTRVEALEKILTGADDDSADTTINRLSEVLSFLNGVADDKTLMSSFLAAEKQGSYYDINDGVTFHETIEGYASTADDAAAWEISNDGSAFFKEISTTKLLVGDKNITSLFLPASYDASYVGYRIKNTLAVEKNLEGYVSNDDFENSKPSWTISNNGAASFKSVVVGDGASQYPVLTNNNTKFVPALETGVSIGVLTINNTPYLLYAPVTSSEGDIDLSDYFNATTGGTISGSTIFTDSVYIKDGDLCGSIDETQTWSITPDGDAAFKAVSLTNITLDGTKGDAGDVLMSDGNTVTWQHCAKRSVDSIKGDGSTTTFTVTHHLGECVAQVLDADMHVVYVDTYHRSSTNVEGAYDVVFNFATAPAEGTNYSVILVG